MVVNGRKPPPPNEPDEVVVCELLALQRVEGREVPQHRVADRTALETSLRNGRSSDWHRGYIDLALDSGIRMCTWAMLLGEKLTSLRHRYEADIEALQRQRRQYAHEPHPDPATIKIRPPPTRRPRER